MVKVTHKLGSITKDQMKCDKDLKSIVVVRVFSTDCLYNYGIYIQQEIGVQDLSFNFLMCLL